MQPAFKIPEAMAVHVEQIQRGEYDVAGYHPSRPTILDVGANIGGFAIWAAKRWPGCEVFCYEPVPETFLLLKANIEALKSTGGNGQIHPHNVAIGDPARTKMYLGRNNCGEASFFDLGFQQKATVEVVTWPPKEMPAAQILKL
ncbi:MAG TPA: FkbM family methyltransferase, partial [Xanthobacteraceae bacterium]|nr:FkbM family methyltransferase [Xanthobacteraceae bacterium]